MKVNLIAVEVGVRLAPNHPEYSCYEVLPNLSLYDENIVTFLEEDIEKARAYAESYVKEGVPTTYAVLYTQGQCNILARELKELKNNGWYENFSTLTLNDIIDTWYKTESNELKKLV